MTATTFAALKSAADSPNLVRKILEAVAFLGPMDAPEIESLTDSATGALKSLDPLYVPVGLVTPDGYTFGGDTNTETVEALGYAQPVREDITSQTRTVSFTALETDRRPLLELVYGMDLSAVEMGPKGEVVFDHPDRPLKRNYRLIVIGRDGDPTSEWLRGKFFPSCSITGIPEEVWSAADPRQYEIELSTYVDDEVGTGERDFIAGSGALAAQTQLGFDLAGE